MTASSLKIRWFNDACYEIHLPNGKGILIDPFIERSEFRLAGRECVEAADYVLVSHTHFDHVMEIPYFRERFDCEILAPKISGIELARQYNVPGAKICLCSPGDEIQTDDFRVECYRSRHTNLGMMDCPLNWKDNLKRDGLPAELEMLSLLGSYEYLNYKITFPWNQRLLIWGGGATEDAIAQARQYEPDISIAQLPRETPQQIARLYAAIGGRYILPHHHEYFLVRGEEGRKVIEDTIAETNRLAPYTTVLLPEKGVWYQFDMEAKKV
ncbi:MAG: MBL fold metallo-hydrolase [Clostridiales bacterium]|nr:MBL fold metallo-hydrolase [Clostridiales bacterium]